MLSKFYLNEIFNSDRTKMATLDIKIQIVNYLPGNVKQIFSELYIIIPMIALVNDLPYYNLHMVKLSLSLFRIQYTSDFGRE